MNEYTTTLIALAKEIANEFGFRDELYLINELLDLNRFTIFNNVLSRMIDGVNNDKKTLENAVKNAKATLTSLQNLPQKTKDDLKLAETEKGLQCLIESEKKLISFKPPKKYPYSKLPGYISRLAGIFHEGTGKMPICTHGQNYEEEHCGNFYNFLLAVKPFLTRIGVKRDIQPNTLGKHAFQQVNGYKKKGVVIPSYQELLKSFAIY